ncbi:mo25 protein [Moniliophthora roreri]|nr:mo25 protein [Moniliophthora roreri]
MPKIPRDFPRRRFHPYHWIPRQPRQPRENVAELPPPPPPQVLATQPENMKWLLEWGTAATLAFTEYQTKGSKTRLNIVDVEEAIVYMSTLVLT